MENKWSVEALSNIVKINNILLELGELVPVEDETVNIQFAIADAAGKVGELQTEIMRVMVKR